MASKRKSTSPALSFADEANKILNLPIEAPINKLGGYGPDGEVIYHEHPAGAPSVLVDHRDNATATFMTNGSTAFAIHTKEGLDVNILKGSFDPVEKREVGPLSGNVWLSVDAGNKRKTASLINPHLIGVDKAHTIKVVKVGDPERAIWYCAWFGKGNLAWSTAIKHSMIVTPVGPALVRQVYIKNSGKKSVRAKLWSHYALSGTQLFVYNKEIWYDRGIPLSPKETIIAATIPYSDVIQIKRVSSQFKNLTPAETTCDYSEFVGHSAHSAVLPEAVRRGALLGTGAGQQMNRFATTTLAANAYTLSLRPGAHAILEQSVLYVESAQLQKQFGKASDCKDPRFPAIAKAFKQAGMDLLKKTPDIKTVLSRKQTNRKREPWPEFEFHVENNKAVSEYAKSVWTGVKELYENCRAHGAKMAEGIELGTRDRGQDMWPKMKEDPGRVRTDLIHALSFMYVNTYKAPASAKPSKRMTLPEKLHGLFPRQFPSRWDRRNEEVRNDNRPYADSPLWLVNSLVRYIRETGDLSILQETVQTVRLTDPLNPETSGIVGHKNEQTVLQTIFGIFAWAQRLTEDTPYGMLQILYGDWCDPVDMFGTSIVGDDRTRGHGRGVQTRLSAHLFVCLIEMIDLLEASKSPKSKKVISKKDEQTVESLKRFSNTLRTNIIRWAWENGRRDQPAGFIDCIHELKANGKKPNYRKGEKGYTLGSMLGKDFDGINRRVLSSQAYGLEMLQTDRSWLRTPSGRDQMVSEILKATDKLFFHNKLGLVLYSTPLANTQRTVSLVGRIGVLPAGCAENGEYHHAQVMMHLFRLSFPKQADKAWMQFKMIFSAMRDESLCGPFDMPATSYVAAPNDPHFGKGMYFGLSGSTDWIVEIFERIAGLQLNLHDTKGPVVQFQPNLPSEFGGELRFRRFVHFSTGSGTYRTIPIEVWIRKGLKKAGVERGIKINGVAASSTEVQTLEGVKKLRVEIFG